MKLFTCTDHNGFWPVGVASIVLARGKGHARSLLDKELTERRLELDKDEPYTLVEVDMTRAKAVILRDGNY